MIMFTQATEVGVGVGGCAAKSGGGGGGASEIA